MKESALAMTGYLDKGKKTRREQFLAEMDEVIRWSRLYGLIERITRRRVRREGARGCRWSGCFGSTACSSGTTCEILVRRKRCTIRSRCAALPGSARMRK